MFRQRPAQGSFDFRQLVEAGHRGAATPEFLASVCTPLLVSLQAGRVTLESCEAYVETLRALPINRRAQWCRLLTRVLPGGGGGPQASYLSSAVTDISYLAHAELAEQAIGAGEWDRAKKILNVVADHEPWATLVDPRVANCRRLLANRS